MSFCTTKVRFVSEMLLIWYVKPWNWKGMYSLFTATLYIGFHYLVNLMFSVLPLIGFCCACISGQLLGDNEDDDVREDELLPVLSPKGPTSLMSVSDRPVQSPNHHTLNWLLLCEENRSGCLHHMFRPKQAQLLLVKISLIPYAVNIMTAINTHTIAMPYHQLVFNSSIFSVCIMHSCI